MTYMPNINLSSPSQRISTNCLAGFFTVAEAAEYLRVSDKSIRRLIARGLLSPSKALRKLIIPRQQLETFYERTQ
jgi:excisionase family DNA binding protein